MAVWTSVVVLLGVVWFASESQAQAQGGRPGAQPQCRCFPGDDCWPSTAEWAAFNKTIGGRLIATVPVASVCHDSFPGVSYDAAKCAAVQNNWPRPGFHDATTHSPMTAFFANSSCDPFTPRTAQCVVGAYVQYAVNATGGDHYAKTIAFASKNNIHLVIRNTGHDWMGKSTGPGAMALWTHHIKARSIIDYKSATYSGKAIKIGAGVQAFEAQRTANDAGYVVVTGDCPTVGIAGGYTQGGGTSPLASKFGLGADQVLEWEVITADGQLRTASPTKNPDLYWALSGGGGGTYGAVLSMTAKLHRNLPTGGASLTFVDSSDDAFWKAVQAVLVNLPAVMRAGAVAFFQIVPPVYTGLPGNMFSIPQLFLPGGNAKDVQKLLQPTLKALNATGVSYTFVPSGYANFQDAFYTQNPEQNITEINVGGRLIPRSLVENSNSAAALTDGLKSITARGGIAAGLSMDVSRPPQVPNSAHPEWRKTLFLAFVSLPYDRYNFSANIAAQRVITDVFQPTLEALTPGGGAYLNEADFNQPNWQEAFYGVNYPRLLSIKRKYDPSGIFWGLTTVGSEAWEQTGNGRLCKSRK